ncbi:hypothetical protein ABZ756_07215 [Mammaliicoccus sciuri]
MDKPKTNSSFLQQDVPEEKLKSVSIEMNGEEKCHQGIIVINGFQMGDGVSAVTLVMNASDKPAVKLRYSHRHIPQDVADSLGLKKYEG